jgi:23S rRNA pseudouridine1911/1915/1917 synthase
MPTRPRKPPARNGPALTRNESALPKAIYTVEPYGAGMRLDAYLSRYLSEHSRSEWHRLIESGAVTLSGEPTKAALRLAGGERLEVRSVASHEVLEPDASILLTVVYEDAAMVVIDKPAGLVVHPAPGHETGTLVHALLARFPEMQDPTGEKRPGIVHRIDKDTSGLLVVGKTVEAVAALQAQMQRGETTKRYRLLVGGVLQEERGEIDAPIGRDRIHRQKMAVRPDGRPSLTDFRVLERFNRYTYVDAGLPSGRTHQLRVHFSSIGHPVAGDHVYGSGRAPGDLRRQFVHSAELTLTSPATRKKETFHSPLPADLEKALSSLRNAERPGIAEMTS